MYRRILLLCDLEGVNKVVGVPYEGLRRDTEQWEIARRQAPLELNAAADAFRVNPAFDTKELMQNLGTGEAVVSMLDEKGAPSVAEYAFILPPESRMGAITEEERRNAVDYSPLNNKYLNMIDNLSAYEVITGRVPGAAAAPVGRFAWGRLPRTSRRRSRVWIVTNAMRSFAARSPRWRRTTGPFS